MNAMSNTTTTISHALNLNEPINSDLSSPVTITNVGALIAFANVLTNNKVPTDTPIEYQSSYDVGTVLRVTTSIIN